MLFHDDPVRPAVERFHSDAAGTHGWHQVPCYAGEAALDQPGWHGDRPVSVDIESFGLDRYSARLKCVSFSDGRMAVVLDPRHPHQCDAIKVIINHAPKLIFHNSAFDVPNLSRNGLIGPAHCRKIEDTLIHARLAEPGSLLSKSLINVGHRYLGTPQDDHLLAAFKIAGLTKEQGYYQFDIDRYIYLLGAASDALITARVFEHVQDAAYDRLTTGHPFTDNGVASTEAWDLIESVQQFNRIMLRRACRGLRVDLEFMDRYQERTAARAAQTEHELAELSIRPGNSGDLITFLERENAIPEDYPRTPKTKKPSTLATNLERIVHPVVKLYVEQKQIAKIGNDYLSKVVDQSGDDGRIYPALNVLAAVTGRASMSGVPLHQFPADARGIVLCDDGDPFTSVDWSQIEPVVIANIAGDHDVVQEYESGRVDFYEGVAQHAGIPRPTAKVVLLAQLYGEGLAKLATDLGIPRLIEKTEDGEESSAEALRALIFETLPRTAALVQPASAGREGRLRRIGRDYGVMFTLAGRIVPIPFGRGWEDPDTGEVGPPSRAVHKAVNYFVQGSAFDVLMHAVINGDAAGLGDTIYLTMHDELVISTEAAMEWAKIMQTPSERLCRLAKRVPLLRTDQANMGERWAKV